MIPASYLFRAAYDDAWTHDPAPRAEADADPGEPTHAARLALASWAARLRASLAPGAAVPAR